MGKDKNLSFEDRAIQRPIQTNWMSSRGLKALQVKSGYKNTFIQTEDLETGKKGVISLGIKPFYDDESYPDKE